MSKDQAPPQNPRVDLKSVDLQAFSPLVRELASTFVSMASDIALVIDQRGVISCAYVADAGLSAAANDMVGRPWAQTVSNDTRRKIELLLQEARSGGAIKRREVNHRFGGAVDVPIAYCAIQLGVDGPVLAVGRDLRSVAAIAQRLLDTQQEMEKSYWDRRRQEERYAALFEVLTDAVLVIDAGSQRIVNADRSAIELTGCSHEQLIGSLLTDHIEAPLRPAVAELLSITRSTGKASQIKTRLAIARAMAKLSTAPFRPTRPADAPLLILVRLRCEASGDAAGELRERIKEIVDHAAQAVVISNGAGRIVSANRAFTDLCQVHSETQLLGMPLEQSIVDPNQAVAGIIESVKSHGLVAARQIQIGQAGSTNLVTASLLSEGGDQERIGFVFRALPDQTAGLAAGRDRLIGELSTRLAQFGKTPLPELIRGIAELTEQQLLINALVHSAGNREAAAALLGISVESLALYTLRHDLNFVHRDLPRGHAGDSGTRH